MTTPKQTTIKRVVLQRMGQSQRVLDLDTGAEVLGYKSATVKAEPGKPLKVKLVFEPELVDVQVLDAPETKLDMFDDMPTDEADVVDVEPNDGPFGPPAKPRLLTSGEENAA